MDKLRECPFCGGESSQKDISNPFVNGWIGCKKCHCFINWVKSGKHLAISAWNTRATDAEVARLTAELERYRKAEQIKKQQYLDDCMQLNQRCPDYIELEQYRKDEADGRLVRLPETLTAPYELNDRYWVCGWDSDDYTLIIQDRKLRDEAEAALKAQEVPHAEA